MLLLPLWIRARHRCCCLSAPCRNIPLVFLLSCSPDFYNECQASIKNKMSQLQGLLPQVKHWERQLEKVSGKMSQGCILIQHFMCEMNTCRCQDVAAAGWIQANRR